MDETRYSLQELTQAANVSVRTVRYYIAEGLLPPPVSAGARSSYSSSHLDRLRLIGLLKDSFLPLKEIRRRLMGLDDDAVRIALADLEQQNEDQDDLFLAELAVPDHRYPLIDRSMRRSYRLEEQSPTDSASDYISRVLDQNRPMAPGKLPRPATPPPSPPSESDIWRRISLGDDAELLISDELFLRRKERIDALVIWAKRVLSQD